MKSLIFLIVAIVIYLIFDHDVDSIVVDFPKPPIFDDISTDEVKTQQAVEALQPDLMVMLGHHCYKVIFTYQKIVETMKAPRHSFVYTKDQSNTQIFLPPPESHDPITHPLEESYTTSTLARRQLYLFLMFACLSQSRECV